MTTIDTIPVEERNCEVIALRGDYGSVCLPAIQRFKKTLRDVSSEADRQVIVDLTKVEKIGAAFTGVLAVASRSIWPRRLALSGLNESCRSVLEMTGVNRLVDEIQTPAKA